jgi:transposase
LPGVGRIVVTPEACFQHDATLLAEAWDALLQRDYHALRALCGAAPVTKSSGKSRIVIRRMACHPRLANAIYHWARVAIQHDPISRLKYSALRKKGHSHGRALRSVADRLLGVACAMLKAGTLFDPTRQCQNTPC